MLFRGNVLVGYDFDTEGSDFDEMVKNGTLVFSEERGCYILSNTENDKEINILKDGNHSNSINKERRYYNEGTIIIDKWRSEMYDVLDRLCEKTNN